MRPKTSVKPLATRKYSAARVSPFMAVLRKSFALSARPHTTNAAAGTPITTPQNHRQKRDMPALAHPIHEAAIDRDRTGGAAGGSRATERSGPPESGASLEERRVRRVGDGAGRAGAARGARTRPPHATWTGLPHGLFAHKWCGLRDGPAPARLRGADLGLLVEDAVLHDREQLGGIA